MTHEQRASMIKKVFWIVMIVGIAVGVWFYPDPAAEGVTPNDESVKDQKQVQVQVAESANDADGEMQDSGAGGDPQQTLTAKPNPVAVAEAGPAVKVSDDALAIVHHHLPGDPASEQLAGVLNNIQRKYGRQVVVTRVDVRVDPAASRAEGVTKAPHVIISARGERVFDFQGAWPQPQLERKIDELLRGLKRFGKDWRPAVPGMRPAGS